MNAPSTVEIRVGDDPSTDPALNPRIDKSVIEVEKLDLFYGSSQALKSISLKIAEDGIGPKTANR